MTVDTPAPGDVSDRIAAAVRGVSGVADLHSGMFGEIGTYLPGRRVPGIRVAEGVAEVHISVVFGVSIGDTAAAVRSAVGAQLPDVTTVNVIVEDVVPVQSPSRGTR